MRDDESPEHLERLRDFPQIKVALLRFSAQWPEKVARFERVSKNTAYWLPVEALDLQFLEARRPEERCSAVEMYGRSWRLISTMLAPRPDSPYAIAMLSADDPDMDAALTRLRSVCHDYWYGSTFWK